MDKIKDFFTKRKTKKAFKKAGEGQRLGTMGEAEKKQIMQQQLEQEQREQRSKALSARSGKQPSPAALAAQRRLEEKKRQDAKSAAAIRNPSLLRATATTSTTTASIRQASESAQASIPGRPLAKAEADDDGDGDGDGKGALKVMVVCPVTGDLVREKEKNDHLYNVLSDALPEMPLEMAAKMVWSLNAKSVQETAVKTITAYLQNTLKDPDNEKFKRINRHNKAFQTRIMGATGAFEFLCAAGFLPETIASNTGSSSEGNEAEDDEESETPAAQYLALDPNIDPAALEQASALINSDQRVVYRLHRDLRVYRPAKGASIAEAARVSLPDDFYTLSADELKEQQRRLKNENERNDMLLTQAMRAGAPLKKKYKFCLIRVRFPDGIIIQGTFHVVDRVSTLRRFVQEKLQEESRPFVLFTHPDRSKIEDVNATLADAKLTPMRLINFAWEDGGVEKKSVLKQSVLDISQPL